MTVHTKSGKRDMRGKKTKRLEDNIKMGNTYVVYKGVNCIQLV